MSTELIKAEPKLTQKDLDDWLLGSDTKLNEKQKMMFYNVALANQLNPIKREIYAIAYGNNFNIITGYEVYLKRAERTGKLEYWKATVEKRDNEWIGICTVKRTDRTEPTTIEAWLNEYNQGNKMWKEKPRTMIRKVAIAQAFRMSFPDELGGMPYTSDEMGEVIEAQVVPEKKTTQGSTKGKGKIVAPEPSQEVAQEQSTSPGENWDTKDEDLSDIRDLMVESETDEEKVLGYYKVNSLEELDKQQAGHLQNKLTRKLDKILAEDHQVD